MKQFSTGFMVILGMVLLGGCGRSGPPSVSQTQSQPVAASSEQVAQTVVPQAIAPPSPTGNLPDQLTASQDALKRLPQVSVGRANPFAAITPAGPIQFRPRALPPSGGDTPALSALPAPPTILQPLSTSTRDIVAPTALPPTPVVSSPSSSSIAAPPLGVAPSLASQIRISGIIQIGDQFSVLVEVPNGGGSRPVQVGEDIISGRVRLARVDVAANQEPQVILEEAGVETVKTVNSGV